jgi:hypothetical protein
MEAYRSKHGPGPLYQRTEKPKDQSPHDSTLQGNCSHRIRRRTTTPEAIFFAFLFHFSYFHHFTANVTRALPLEVIKGEAGATSRRDETIKQQQL